MNEESLVKSSDSKLTNFIFKWEILEGEILIIAGLQLNLSNIVPYSGLLLRDPNICKICEYH